MARYTSSKANPSGRAQREQGGGGGRGGGTPPALLQGSRALDGATKGKISTQSQSSPSPCLKGWEQSLGAEPSKLWARGEGGEEGGWKGVTRAWHSSCTGTRACSSFEELAPAAISAGSSAARSPAVPRAPRGKRAFGDPVLLCTELRRRCMGGGWWGSYFCVMEGLGSNAPDGEGRTAPIYKHAGST